VKPDKGYNKERSSEVSLHVKTFTAYIEWDPETKLYVGIVPGIPGAHTQAATLDELRQNLREALELCLEEQGKDGTRRDNVRG